MVSRVWKHAMKRLKDQDGSDVVLPTASASKHLGPEERAALVITRWGRRYSERKINVDRTRLIERIELERSLHYGLTRVVFFLCIFMLNASLTLVDVGGQYKLDLRNNIRSVLDLDSFDGITTLEQLRDYIPTLGASLKTFAASKNQRYLDPFSMRLLNDRTTFTSPMNLYTPFKVESAEFTLSAWVEVLPSVDPATVDRIAILRKPMQTDTSLTCWGWFHAGEFRYGAHDFHSLNPKELEVSVKADLVLKPGLTHEVMVAKGGMFTFYRNGVVVKSVPSPRPVTDCDGDVVLLGNPSIALASVNFYARGLQANEVAEMYVGGQPLSELATGSVLPKVSIESAAQIIGTVQSSAHTTDSVLEVVKDQTLYNTVLSMGTTKEATALVDNDILHPPDTADSTVFPGSIEVAQLLPEFGKKVWLAGGNQTTAKEETRRAARSWRSDSTHEFWPVIQGPIFTYQDADVEFDFPDNMPANTQGLTMNFWFQQLEVNRSDELNLYLYSAPCKQCKAWETVTAASPHPYNASCPDDCAVLKAQSNGFWIALQLSRPSGLDAPGERLWIGESPGKWAVDDPDQRAPDEIWFNAKRYGEAGPVAWRMLTVSMDKTDKAWKLYLDGKLALHSRTGLRQAPNMDYPLPSWLNLQSFSGGLVKMFNRFDSRETHRTAPALFRAADVRLYQRALSDSEIEKIHLTSRWPISTEWPPQGSLMKQCAQDTDVDFFDSSFTDSANRDCYWYSRHVKKAPYICASFEAKAMCPVTCRGRRACHDGTLDLKYVAPKPKPTYRVFDRIMWLQPKLNSPLICPSDNVTRSELLAKCRKMWDDNGCASCPEEKICTSGCKCHHKDGCPSPKWKSNYDEFYQYHNHMTWPVPPYFKRTDLWDCDALEHDLEERQCAWNSSWIPQFKRDVKETKFYSITVWMKPTKGSYGMPRFFFPFLRLMSRLARPFTLMSYSELKPFFESNLWFYSYGWGSMHSHYISETANVDYRDWHMTYFSVEVHDGQKTNCIALNALPMTCKTRKAAENEIDEDGPLQSFPEEILESVEIYTEVLLAPIEFTSQKESPSQLQKRFYKRKAELEKIKGPSSSEKIRTNNYDSTVEKELGSYDEKLGLVAPPILFQTRLKTAECNKDVADPFLQSQFTLVNSTHCPSPGMCPGVTGANDVLKCVGSEMSLESFYGLNFSSLNGEDGFADFLFTYSDNPIIVRGGQILPTRNFFDSKTQSGQVVTAFVSPENGMLTVLTLGATLDGASVETESEFQMLSFLPKDRRREAVVLAVCLFVVLGLVLVLNLVEISSVLQDLEISAVIQDVMLDGRGEKKLGVQGVLDKYHVGEKLQHLYPDIFEVSYDLLQIIIITVYGVMVVKYNFPAEARSAALVQDLVSVPFVAADVSFDDKLVQFFAALDAVFQEFENKDQLSSFGFAIMILNLIKILQTTGAHPRVGVLVSTLGKALDDLVHFGILFIVIFLTFAYTGMWTFSNERSEFATLQAGMTTQFAMLNGEFPEGFEEDNRMIAYAVVTFAVQFLLMLNFLLAIVVDSYAAVKEDIKEQETDKDIFSDVFASVINGFTAFWKKWPSGLHRKLKTKLVVRAIGPSHLVNALGISEDAARSIIETYSKNEAVPFAADDRDVYDSKLLQHAAKVMGRKEAHAMVDLSSGDIQREELQKQIQQLNERMSRMNQQIMARLDAMSALPSTTSNGFRPTGISSPPPTGQSAQRSPGHINIVASTQPMAQMTPLNAGERAVTGLDGQLVYLH